MSIFITNLAFADQPELINASKMSVFAASLMAGVLGYLWLRFCGSGEAKPA
jgi:NhaA family Na+:H+ antiporter